MIRQVTIRQLDQNIETKTFAGGSYQIATSNFEITAFGETRVVTGRRHYTDNLQGYYDLEPVFGALCGRQGTKIWRVRMRVVCKDGEWVTGNSGVQLNKQTRIVDWYDKVADERKSKLQ